MKFKDQFCPFVDPPENGLISSNRLSTPNGFLPNTTIEFTCLPGYTLHGMRFYQCMENVELSRAEWSDQMSIKCEPEITTTTLSESTTTSTITTMTTIHYMGGSAEADNIDDDIGEVDFVRDDEDENGSIVNSNNNQNKDDQQPPNASVNFEACKIDAASMLLSYANSNDAVPINGFDEFIFENATHGEYIDHGETVLYHCISNMEAIYAAKCSNGTLFLQQNCHELRKGNIIFC